MPSKRATIDQAKDTALLICLILLLCGAYYRNLNWLTPTIVILLLVLVWPVLFRPLAGCWFGLSRHLGNFTSKIILGVIFLTIVTPVGLIRRLAGADAMRLRQWHADSGTAFLDRNHKYTGADLEKPY